MLAIRLAGPGEGCNDLGKLWGRVGHSYNVCPSGSSLGSSRPRSQQPTVGPACRRSHSHSINLSLSGQCLAVRLTLGVSGEDMQGGVECGPNGTWCPQSSAVQVPGRAGRGFWRGSWVLGSAASWAAWGALEGPLPGRTSSPGDRGCPPARQSAQNRSPLWDLGGRASAPTLHPERPQQCAYSSPTSRVHSSLMDSSALVG